MAFQEAMDVIGVLPCLDIMLRTVVEQDVLFPPRGLGVEEFHQLLAGNLTAVKSFLKPLAQVLLRAGLGQLDLLQEILNMRFPES